MKLNVHDIEEAAKGLTFDEPTETLNEVLVHGAVHDYEFPTPASVLLEYYRSGQELFLRGHITSRVIGHCGRCVEPYSFNLSSEFNVVLVPKLDVPKSDIELADKKVVGLHLRREPLQALVTAPSRDDVGASVKQSARD